MQTKPIEKKRNKERKTEEKTKTKSRGQEFTDRPK